MNKQHACNRITPTVHDFTLVSLMTPGSARQFFNAVLAVAPRTKRLYRLPFSWHSYPQQQQIASQALKTYLQTARRGHWTKWLPQRLSLAILGAQYAGMRQHFEQDPRSVGMCWNGLDRSRFIFSQAARDAGRPCLHAELAPLPNCLTLDPNGVNALNSLPREADHYLQWAAEQPDHQNWALQTTEFQRRKPKIATSSNPTEVLPKGPYVFVPLQVPGDSQIRYFGDWIHSIQDLVKAVTSAARHLPEGWHVRIKEHPSSRVSLTDWIRPLLGDRCFLSNTIDTYELIENAGTVLTINSSVGLQAFFFNKPVLVLGQAFFGFEPLTVRVRNQKELIRSMVNMDRFSVNHELRKAYVRYLREKYFFPGTLADTHKLSEKQHAHLMHLIHQTLHASPAA